MTEPAIRQLGRYRIVAEIGRGAMGVVYEAVDPLLDRTVAVKTIHLAADSAERAEYEARFLQEAKAAAGLNHPNIVTVYDIGRDGDTVYLAMERLHGDELRELLLHGRLPVERAIDIAAQVADGLAFAHDRKVIHRDIKPANIMLVRNGPVKIMDFGIARLHVSDVKTQTGLLLGSPRYMAPEQLAGGAIDHRADLFALGVVLYEMLTGVSPFAGEDVPRILYQIANLNLPAPSAANPAAPVMLDLAVAKALAKDPSARYGNARELAADLRACAGKMTDRAAPTAAGGNTTMRLAVPAGGFVRPDIGAETTPRLAVSRAFDSSQGLRRLVAGVGPASLGASRRRRRKRWFVTAGVTIATLIALAIAFG